MTQDFFLNSWLKSWISRSLQFGWYWLGQFGMTEINSTLRRPKFNREIFWMEQLVFWGNTRDSWLPTNIHKLLPWCSFLVIGSFWLYFQSCIFFYFSLARCLLCQGSYFVYVFFVRYSKQFYLFSQKKQWDLNSCNFKIHM